MVFELRASATISVRLPARLANAFANYTKLAAAVALLIGGGAQQGLWSDAVVELVFLPLLAWALFKLAPHRLSRDSKWALILLAAILLLPLVQLIPWPPAIWTSLPARDKIAAGYRAAGMALPWLPISLDPAATARSLLSLLPAAAIFLAMLSLDNASRRALVKLVLFIAFVSVCIGFIQIMGEQGYFYAITNPGMAVGFFANGNHNAAFLACAIPYAGARVIDVYSNRQSSPATSALTALLLAVLVIGVAVVGSRAGLGLGFVAGLLCIAMGYRDGFGGRRGALTIALAGFLVASLIAFQFVLAGWERRGAEDRDIVEDLRWPVATVTVQAAQQYFPLGSGFGTFVPIYQMSSPRSQVFERYVNHAHDDWLEIALEGGLPALACIAGFLAWFGRASVRAWGASVHSNGNCARAGSAAIVLLMLHSVVDYPLRSIAIMTVFALSCGFLIPAKNADTRTAASNIG